MTLVGLVGAVLVGVGFVCAHISPFFVALAIVGLFLNWLGDSLDGTLARYRRIERPHFGYFIDHSCDLIAQTFIFIGLGLSPYFTLPSALFALSMYLLISSYTYLKVMILRTHHLSYGGMGATELRLMIGCWGLFAIWAGPGLISARVMHYRVIDAFVGALWLLTFFGFMWIVRCDLSKFGDFFGEGGERRHAQNDPEAAPIANGVLR